ncbi:hypothetical protein EWM64_g9977 [Hericium alpestre]|uniref:Ribosomal RNA-processing protein 7 C-terminal domain-containing protein n=1 Tax=Hericium alpestre TaxID=135208 RepID=A0A4Y9ZHY5_9AGAM|nr:hypothetical protein EWM64_g9977 [Hericium alpestre]
MSFKKRTRFHRHHARRSSSTSPTDPQRYARPELLDALANEMPLPMIVDAECGMPLDLGKWQSGQAKSKDGAGGGGGKRKRKEKQEKTGFYAFQQHEKKRKELMDLKKRWEEDKAKVEKLKSSRKFRPY